MATPISLLFLFLPIFFSSPVSSALLHKHSSAPGITILSYRAQNDSSIKATIRSIANCRSKTVDLSKFLEKLRKSDGKKYEIMALEDCHSLLMDSKEEMGDSLKELKQYKKDKNMVHVENVQTWLSAALTNIDTCSDGVEEGASEGLKKAIGSRISDVANLMSGSLELVNQLRG
ncbi:hypothetical protein ACLOJK_007130 [Asimina triloba]